MTRECTAWILDAIDEGLLDAITVAHACLIYLSEDDVRDMCHSNELGWPGNDNYSGRDERDDDDESDDESDENKEQTQ